MPKKPKSPIPIEQIDGMIRTIRGTRVMLDRDLAKIYGAPTKAFNQAVKRNRQRFPEDFMFRLTLEEAKALQASRSQFVTLKRGQNVKYLPYAFTEYGALMAANIGHSRGPREQGKNYEQDQPDLPDLWRQKDQRQNHL